MTKSNSVQSPIFIVGPSRSGTTLLRAMLCHHSDVHITAETHWFDDLRIAMLEAGELDDAAQLRCADWFLSLSHRPFGHKGNPDEGWMERNDLTERAAELGGSADDFFSAYCQLDAERQGKSRWGEKTPRHAFRINEIFSAYPNAMVICMARDPRAVVASYRDWKSQGGHDFDRDPEHSKALEKEHQRTRSSYHIFIATLMWHSAVNAGINAMKKHGGDKVFLLRYEDLVLEPDKTNRGVCTWLNLDPQPKMLEVPMVNSSFQEYDTQGGINRAPVEGWKKRLSSQEIGTIQFICRGVMTATGYRRESAGFWYPYGIWKALTFPVSVVKAALANRDRVGSLPVYLWKRIKNL